MMGSNIKKLTDILKGRICKNGRLSIPKEKFPDKVSIGFEQDGVCVSMMRHEDKALVKDYMLQTFYRQAPVPTALGLADTFNKYPMLNDELDLMLDSGCSTCFYDISSGQMAGACINTIWTVDQDIDIDPDEFRDPVAWFKVAANLSNELNDCESSNQNAATVWRDYQFQFIYYMLQIEAKKSGKKFVFYNGMGYTKPEYRTKNIAFGLLKASNVWTLQNGGMLGFMGTFPGFLKKAGRAFSDTFRLLADVPYSEMTLKSSEGKNVFQNLAGGMILMKSNI